MTDAPGTPKKHRLIDRMNEIPAVNELWCSCGEHIMPDCDVSSVSIGEEYERHLAKVAS